MSCWMNEDFCRIGYLNLVYLNTIIRALGSLYALIIGELVFGKKYIIRLHSWTPELIYYNPKDIYDF